MVTRLIILYSSSFTGTPKINSLQNHLMPHGSHIDYIYHGYTECITVIPFHGSCVKMNYWNGKCKASKTLFVCFNNLVLCGHFVSLIP